MYAREMYVITESVKKWQQYLLGRKFHIYTDQQSLRNMIHQTIQTAEQQKWLIKLLGFDYEIHYKPGPSNRVADAFSRKFEPNNAELLAISSPVLGLVDRIKQFYLQHGNGQALIAKWHEDPDKRSKFNFIDGLLYVGERLYVPDACGLQTPILHEFHASPLGGHSGTKATLARIAASFYWPSMKKSTTEVVVKCLVCQQHKSSTQALRGCNSPYQYQIKCGRTFQ